VCNGIYAARQSADYGDAVAHQLRDQALGNLPPVYGGSSGPHHRYSPLILRGDSPSDVEHGWHIVDLLKPGGEGRVIPGERLDLVALQPLQLGVGRYVGPCGDDSLDRLAIQPRRLQLPSAGFPGTLQVAEIALQLGELGASNALYAVESHPVFQV